MKTLNGRAWKFGDMVTTDHICPGRYFHLRTNLPELAKHTLEDARADYAKNVKPGDIVVAGRNFGMGSSREHAPVVIKVSGASAIVAKSFARIFYRNAVNIGLPVVICDTSRIEDGDELSIDLEAGKLVNKTKKFEIKFAPMPAAMMDILSEGGLIPYIQKHGDLKI
ncbi:MAG: 3-isopropylmalate dehydratase small subunit [Thaumarchaeota archaeon]|nr:3-isopropylmalate dehydratase small subunit [Nitrososphaerota archaeon]MCL5316640.1 3-isopropylmalate dehydratase small subunit [Nitrososphaerota archaeon]